LRKKREERKRKLKGLLLRDNPFKRKENNRKKED
jgi:hypothetical protein